MGKIEIDHTGSGSGITLSSDGTSLLLDGTAIGGGGGADLYAANPVSATDPSATGTNAVAIGDGAVASNTESIAIGGDTLSSGYKSFAAAIGNSYFTYGAQGFASIAIGLQSKANQTAAVAIGQSSEATSSNAAALGFNSVASGSGSLALGNVSRSSGTQSISLGDSYSSGADSFAAAIANNTSSYGASGANSIAMGYQAKATATGSMAFGDRNTASGEDAVVFGENNTGSGPWSFTAGRSNTNSGSRGVALGNSHTVSSFYTFASGSTNTASQNYAHAVGSKSLADRQGKFAHASLGFGTVGDSQYGRMVLSKATTDATATVLTALQGNAASSTNMPVIPSGGAQAFSGLIVAKQTSSANAAAWEIKGLIVNNGGTTTLVNSAITVIDNTPSWGGPALSADDTNDWLAITCTGAASTSIRWSCTLNTSELIYA